MRAQNIGQEHEDAPLTLTNYRMPSSCRRQSYVTIIFSWHRLWLWHFYSQRGWRL